MIAIFMRGAVTPKSAIFMLVDSSLFEDKMKVTGVLNHTHVSSVCGKDLWNVLERLER